MSHKKYTLSQGFSDYQINVYVPQYNKDVYTFEVIKYRVYVYVTQ